MKPLQSNDDPTFGTGFNSPKEVEEMKEPLLAPNQKRRQILMDWARRNKIALSTLAAGVGAAGLYKHYHRPNSVTSSPKRRSRSPKRRRSRSRSRRHRK
jgi:hypothetical protein